MGDADATPAATWFSQPTRQFVGKTGWLSILAIGLSFGILGAASVFGLLPSELDVSPEGGTTIRLQRSSSRSADYYLAVHPQGWQSTGIVIDPDDEVTVSASGTVNLGLQRLLESSEMRHTLEEQLSAGGGKVVPREAAARFREAMRANKDTVTPEDYLGLAASEAMRPRHPWIGPSGDPGSITDRSWPGRTAKKVRPSSPYGSLLAVIHPSVTLPKEVDTTDVIEIGSAASLPKDPSRRRGTLWFIVNDVWDGGNPYPEKFYTDNIGMFVVRVSVRHRGWLSSHGGP